MEFNYKVERKSGSVIFSLEGDLIDRGQALELIKEVEQLIEKKQNKFILDLADLKYVNSSGLNILINILTKSRKSGGDVAITALSPKVKELLIITKLNTVFNITNSVDEALSTLNN